MAQQEQEGTEVLEDRPRVVLADWLLRILDDLEAYGDSVEELERYYGNDAEELERFHQTQRLSQIQESVRGVHRHNEGE
jgi:hypothetical protein